MLCELPEEPSAYHQAQRCLELSEVEHISFSFKKLYISVCVYVCVRAHTRAYVRERMADRWGGERDYKYGPLLLAF